MSATAPTTPAGIFHPESHDDVCDAPDEDADDALPPSAFISEGVRPESDGGDEDGLTPGGLWVGGAVLDCLAASPPGAGCGGGGGPSAGGISMDIGALLPSHTHPGFPPIC